MGKAKPQPASEVTQDIVFYIRISKRSIVLSEVTGESIPFDVFRKSEQLCRLRGGAAGEGELNAAVRQEHVGGVQLAICLPRVAQYRTTELVGAPDAA
ncbi:MAG TPA: hypothetical protein VIL86_12655, partial [Tepidisphaeraceae bacterium]